jgi:serine/threonine-protein kinase
MKIPRSATHIVVVLLLATVAAGVGAISSSIPAGAATSPSTGLFTSVVPSRVLDTRAGIGAPAAPVAAGKTVALTVDGVGGVPASGVSAVVLNVTVTQPTGGGYLTVYPAGSSKPLASNLNFVGGETVPNLVIAPVGAGGVVDLYNGSSGTVQLVADVSGWFSAVPPPPPPTQVTVVEPAPTPGGVATDAAGDVFVGDLTNGAVLEIKSGAITPTTLPLSNLDGPNGLAVDAAGDLFVVDTGNDRVLELKAGAPSPVTLPIQAASAHGIAVDSGGDVFVAAASGVLELPAGSTTVTTLPFSGTPYGVAVDSRDDVFATFPASGSLSPVQELIPGATASKSLDLIDLEQGNSSAAGITVDAAGDVFIADSGRGEIVEVSANAAIPPSSFYFAGYPDMIAAAPSGESLFIGDVRNKQLVDAPLPANGASSDSVLPLGGVSDPVGIALGPGGALYIADGGRNQVTELTAGASAPIPLPFTGTAAGVLPLEYPNAVAVNAGGDVFASNYSYQQILELPSGANSDELFAGANAPAALAVDTSGDLFMAGGAPGAGAIYEAPAGSNRWTYLSAFGALGRPTGVAVDAAGDVFAADAATNHILELPAGDNRPVTLPFTGLSSPTALAVDAAGDLFVADAGNYRVVELAAGATTARAFRISGPDATFLQPTALAVDAIGNLFVGTSSDGILELIGIS